MGGDQEIDDVTSGWILSDTYRGMAAGLTVHDALRLAQLRYLELAQAYETKGRAALPPALASVLLGGGQETRIMTSPWCWALTVVGPPPTV